MGNKMINCLCLYMRKAIPFGLQHVLAMFVANLAPVLIVCSAALVRGSGEHLTAAEITQILQCAMFAAGIGTCMQLYPIWKIGSKLPIVMGVSFTFLGSLLIICTNPKLGYEEMMSRRYERFSGCIWKMKIIRLLRQKTGSRHWNC